MINQDSNKPVVWITGVAGFLGQELARQIGSEAEGFCCGLGRGARIQPHMQQVEAGDISAEVLDRLMARTGPPDFVYHLAGGSSVGRSLAYPILDFTNSVNSAAVLFNWLSENASKARVLVASSAAVYGADHLEPIPESSALFPISPYGWHKKMVEDLATLWHQRSNLDVLPVRIFSLFGQGLRKQLFWDIAGRLHSGASDIHLMGSGREKRDWLHVSDAASLLIRLAKAAPSGCGPVNLGSGEAVSVREAANEFVHAIAPNVPVIFSGVCADGDPDLLVADTTKLRDLLTVKNAPPPDFPSNPLKRFSEVAQWYKNAWDEDMAKTGNMG